MWENYAVCSNVQQECSPNAQVGSERWIPHECVRALVLPAHLRLLQHVVVDEAADATGTYLLGLSLLHHGRFSPLVLSLYLLVLCRER